MQISGQVSFLKFFNNQHPKFHIKISNRISLILVFIPLLCSSHHKFLNIVSLWHSLSLSNISKVVANKTLKECSFKVNFVFEILCVTNLIHIIIYLFTDFKLVEVKDDYTTKKSQLLQSFKSVASQTLVEVFIYWYKDNK